MTQQHSQGLAALATAGQSIWLDAMRRSHLTEGTLANYRDQYGLGGVTTNPAIFGKAFESDEYDEQIAQLAQEGLDAREIYRRIAQQDVRDACDIFFRVYENSGRCDGFVSLEVDPDLAKDAEATLAQANDYWAAIDRPNLMVKIPATPEGTQAIGQAFETGINVNVTLLFGVEAYEQVMEIYLTALETRLKRGEDLDVHSVASFFVSRADSEIDATLRATGHHELKGTAGIANARAAYAAWKTTFGGERFAALAEHGAVVQRPLWASTGVKDPSYPAGKYVEALIGRNTVNTMPLPTLEAISQTLQVSAETAAIDPTSDLEALTAAGIDMTEVTKTLLREGLERFAAPMTALLETIEKKRERGAHEPAPSASDETSKPMFADLRAPASPRPAPHTP